VTRGFETMTPDRSLRTAELSERCRPLRLRSTQQHDGALTVLAMGGHLVRDGVAELERLCQGVIGPLALDLTDLQHVEAEGLVRLNALADTGAPRRGVAPSIARLLGRARR
jgi:hypothetical protein